MSATSRFVVAMLNQIVTWEHKPCTFSRSKVEVKWKQNVITSRVPTHSYKLLISSFSLFAQTHTHTHTVPALPASTVGAQVKYQHEPMAKC